MGPAFPVFGLLEKRGEASKNKFHSKPKIFVLGNEFKFPVRMLLDICTILRTVGALNNSEDILVSVQALN
jgi:hypothetical protein